MAESKPAEILRSNNEHNFAYQDLRDWLAEAEKLGELETITGASWELARLAPTEVLTA